MSDELTPAERRRIRARKLLDRRFFLTVVLLIALIALGGWLAYEPLVDPAAGERDEVVGSFEEEGNFTHEAVVQRSTSVFDEGEVVRERPIYYTRISPNITGTYEYEYRANEGSLDVVSDTYLLLRSVDDEGNEHWRQTEPLERAETENVSPGETVSIDFKVNVSEVVQKFEAIEADLGADPGDTESKVIVQTRADGETENGGVANTHTAEFVLDADEGTYSVETETNGQASEEYVTTVETEREYGPLRAYGPLVLVVIGLVGVAGLGVQRFRGELAPTEAELAALSATRQREEFNDWISTGRFPEAEMNGPRVDVDSLEDIVDVAIDCDGRVIENADGYYVPDGDLYYAYQPDASETEGESSESKSGEVATFEGDPSDSAVQEAANGGGEGESSDAKDTYLGFGLFLGGIGLAAAALAFFLYGNTLEAQSAAYFAWSKPAYATAMVALPVTMLGIVTSLHSERWTLWASVAGVLVALVAVGSFLYVYPDDWNGLGADYSVEIVALYAVGLIPLTASTGAALLREYPDGFNAIGSVLSFDEEDAGVPRSGEEKQTVVAGHGVEDGPSSEEGDDADSESDEEPVNDTANR